MTKRRDKKKHTFWKKIHFKYRLSIINENTLEEIMKFHISRFSGTAVFLGFMFFFITITSVIIITTPIRNYLPGYLDSEIREKAIKADIQADSLEQELQFQAAYISNLQSVFEGKVQADSMRMIDTVSVSENDKALLSSSRERKFNERFEEEEKYTISVLPGGSTAPTEGVTFFRPVKGMVSDKFNNATGHYGIDLVAPPQESVVATLEGTVIFTAYDANVGHVIQLQHKNGFISIYKHNAMLLKKMGDKVRTGEAIAIVGNTGKLSSGPHLHFELWYKGNPINPELYITF